MSNTYQRDYIINDAECIVSANFTDGTIIAIFKDSAYSYDMDEYIDFEGNMKDFIKHKVT